MQREKSTKWGRALALAIGLGLTGETQAGGGLNGDFTTVSYLNPGSEEFLYFTPADPTRLQVKANVSTVFTVTTPGAIGQYRYLVRMLDGFGQSVMLRTEDGSATPQLALPGFTVSAAGTPTRSLALTLADAPLPGATRLNPYTAHRIEVTLQYFSAGTWVNEGPLGQSPDRRFFHFPNRVSGDSARNVITDIISARWIRTYGIDTSVEVDRGLEAEVSYLVFRYDDFESPPALADVPMSLTVGVRAGGSGIVTPTETEDVPFAVPTTSYRLAGGPVPWRSALFTRRIRFRPNAPLPSATESAFRAAITLLHQETSTSPWTSGDSMDADAAPVLHFNGRLAWGNVITTITDIANDPTASFTREPGAVITTLKLSGLAIPEASIPSMPVDAEVLVSLADSGDARVLDGHVSLVLPPTARERHSLRYRLGNPVQLGPDGAEADVTLLLPAGMGVGRPGEALRATLTARLRAFNVRLEPAGTNDFPLALTDRVVLDTRPLYFQAPTLSWRVEVGDLVFVPSAVDYVRREALATLATFTDLPPEQVLKPSNERFYEFVSGLAGTAVVRITPEGRTGLTARMALAAGQFIPHFPLGVTTAWNSGELVLADDLPAIPTSGLFTAGAMMVEYEQGCPDGPCAGQTAGLEFEAAKLLFTPDSGLVAEGAAPGTSGNSLAWGHNPGRHVFAHGVGPFQQAGYAMAGHVLLGGGVPAAEIAQAPTALLQAGAEFNGVGGETTIRMIRPGSAAYARGLGHYPGLNLRRAVEADPAAVRGRARLGDAAADAEFEMSNRAQYYARRSGVSGLHEAAEGGFPSGALQIYGYPFEFASFALSFLSNQNEDSATRCRIRVPFPVDETLHLDELTFTCVGAPRGAGMAAGRDALRFAYWLADVDARGVEFASQNPETAACDAAEKRFLGLGSVVHVSGVQTTLAGTLYLSPLGFIITPADAERPAGGSFHLGAGALVSVAGVMDAASPPVPTESYSMVLAKAYFNDSRMDGGVGWLNLFGHVRLPFYGSTAAHLTAGGTKNLADPYYFNGGWSEGGLAAADPTGDPAHRGKPGASMTWRDYREGTGYPVEARGEFLDVINLSFPLLWHAGSREFSGVDPIASSILVIHTQRELHRLSAKDIQVQFGVEKNLPRLVPTLETIGLVDTSGGVTSLGAKIAEALGEPALADLEQGLASLRAVAGEQLQAQWRQLAAQMVARIAPELRSALRAACPADGSCDEAALAATARAIAAWLRLDERTLLLGEEVFEQALRPQLTRNLTKAAETLEYLFDEDDGVFSGGVGGGSLRSAKVIRALLTAAFEDDLEPWIIEAIGALGYPLLDQILAPLQGDLSRMASVLARLAQRARQLRDRYAADDGDLYLELRALFGDPLVVAELNGIIERLAFDLAERAARPRWVSEHVGEAGDELERQLAADLANLLVTSDFFRRLDRILKYHLRGFEEAALAGLGDGLGLVQRMVRTAAREIIRLGDDFASNILSEPWQKRLLFAKAEGYAWFSGDEVRRLRIMGEGGADFGEEFKFKTGVKFEVSALDSEGEISCGTGGAVKATECLLEFSAAASTSAEVAAPFDPRYDNILKHPDPEVQTTSESFALYLKASLDESDSISGFGGGFNWPANRKFGSVLVKRVAGAAMFGAAENYLAGALEAHFGGESGVDLQGGLFLGRTCSRAPLVAISPRVGRLLGPGERPFTGFYVYGEGWVPVLSASCLLNVSLGAGVGVLADFESSRYGGTILGGVKGRVLCVMSAHGELELSGVGSEEGLVLDGALRCRLELGACPFCVTFSKEFGLTYRSAPDTWETR